jgi:hypothetical protein
VPMRRSALTQRSPAPGLLITLLVPPVRGPCRGTPTATGW